MNEVKSPKKPLIYYYIIAMLVVVLLNALLLPWIAKQQIVEVDYGTFITMTEKNEIGGVQVQDNQIIFTGKDGRTVYKTGKMDDPDLVARLQASSAVYGKEIIEEASPLLSFLLSWILPMAMFIGIGQIVSK